MIYAVLLMLLGASPGPSPQPLCLSESSSSDVVQIAAEFQFSSNAASVEWMYRSLRPRLKIGRQNFTPKNVSIDEKSLNSVFCIEDGHLPEKGGRFFFDIGPRQYSIVLRPIVPYTKLRPSMGASALSEGQMKVSIIDQEVPTWITLRQGRLLRAAGGAILVELTLHNWSSSAVPVTELHLFASSVPFPEVVICRESDSAQTVDLDWDVIIPSSGADGARTKLRDVDVIVPVTFNFIGTCGTRYFSAEVPLIESIEAKGMTVVTVALRELPRPASRDANLRMDRFSPGFAMPLARWPFWEGRIEAGLPVFPQTSLLIREDKGDSRE